MKSKRRKPKYRTRKARKIMKITDNGGILGWSNGSVFFLLNDALNVRLAKSCREEFCPNFLKDTKYVGYYWRGVLDFDKFVEFWREIEKRLGLKETVIHKGEVKDTVVLEIDPWWAINSTRRQFFTLFLRCGVGYYYGDFDDAFKKYELACCIPLAIAHFLSGHTTPTYDSKELSGHNGVVSKFSFKTQDQLNELLVKVQSA